MDTTDTTDTIDTMEPLGAEHVPFAAPSTLPENRLAYLAAALTD